MGEDKGGGEKYVQSPPLPNPLPQGADFYPYVRPWLLSYRVWDLWKIILQVIARMSRSREWNVAGSDVAIFYIFNELEIASSGTQVF